MTQIRAIRADETKVYIECDSGTAMELYEHFSFFVPNYKFMPAFKNKMWDGKIHQFDRRLNSMPFGLLGNLAIFAKSRGYDLVIDSSIGVNMYGGRQSVKEIDDFIMGIPLRSGGDVIEPRVYQREAVARGIRSGRSVLLSPTGSGKSLIIYLMARWFLKESDGRCLIVVPTTSLVEQMTGDFLDYSSHDSEFDESDIHKIYSGKEKSGFKSRVVISTWQSLYKQPASWFDEYEMVVGDEAHTFKAKSLITIMNKLRNAWFRVGTTGTLDGTLVNESVLNGCFGPTYQVTTTKDLIDNDTLSQMSIDVITLQYTDDEKKKFGKMKYDEEIKYIVGHTRRNDFIRELALDQTGNTLILFNLVALHGEPLFRSIEKIAGDRSVFYVSGKVPVDDRERIRTLTEKETGAIIVASAKTFSTGINIKNLHNIIFAAPTKSQIQVLQSIGRSLRKADNKQPAKIFDICDDLSWKSRKNYTLKHGVERVKLYIKEHLDFKIISKLL